MNNLEKVSKRAGKMSDGLDSGGIQLFTVFTVLPSSMSSNIKDGNKQGKKPQLKQTP